MHQNSEYLNQDKFTSAECDAMKEYFCKMVDSSPALAKNFIDKFETMREARKKVIKSII